MFSAIPPFFRDQAQPRRPVQCAVGIRFGVDCAALGTTCLINKYNLDVMLVVAAAAAAHTCVQAFGINIIIYRGVC